MTQKGTKEAVEKQMEQEQMEQKMEKIIIEGTIVSARFGANKFDDTNKYRISIKSDSIPYDEIHAYDEVGPKMTPSWYKNRDGYINLSSIYDIPIKDARGNTIDFEKWTGEYNFLGSLVRVSIKQKDGAIYPQAIRILEDGEERDPFEGL